MKRTAVRTEYGHLVVGEMGSGDRSPLVVVVPGLRGHDSGLSGVCRPLAAVGHKVILLNLPGMGLSPPLRVDLDLRVLARVIDVGVGQFGARRTVCLVGHSFGGTVAAACAAEEPAWLSQLVLISPVVQPLRARPWLGSRVAAWAGHACIDALSGLNPGWSKRLIDSNVPGDISNMLLSRRGLTGWLAIMRASLEERQLCDDPASVLQTSRLASEYGCLQFARRVTVPSHVIAGDRDPFASAQELAHLTMSLGDGRLKLIAGGGHLAHHEDSRAVGAALLAALDSKHSSS